MNIYFLHDDPVKAANEVDDKDTMKCYRDGILMLLARTFEDGMSEHIDNHSMTKWVNEQPSHYKWTLQYVDRLATRLKESNRKPRMTNCLKDLKLHTYALADDHTDKWVNPPRCIPKKYKLDYDSYEGDASCHVSSYRGWYEDYCKARKEHLTGDC